VRDAKKIRMLVTLGLLMLVVTSLGCFKVNMDATLKPDLGMEMAMEMAIPLELADQMDDDSTDGMSWADKVTVEEKDGMRIMRAISSVAAGEELGADEAALAAARQKVTHRLSTRYILTMDLAGGVNKPAADEDEGKGDDGTEGADDMDTEAMEALLSGMMSSFKFTMTAHMPGKIISTNGTQLDDNTVLFDVSMEDLMGDEPMRLTALSKLPSYARIGRLADQMILAGADADIATRVVQYVNAGLLPDPPLQIDAKYKLGAEDYLALTEFIGRLDEQLSPDMTEAMIIALGLNRDKISAARIHQAQKAAAEADLRELAIERILKTLK
jgi:hypothetical protein